MTLVNPQAKPGAFNPRTRINQKQDLVFVLSFLFILIAVTIADGWWSSKPKTQLTPAFLSTPGTFSSKLQDLGTYLQDVEATLERHSTSRNSARTQVQDVLTHRFGLGNERVTVTSQGLLFHQDLEWLTTPGFLRQKTAPIEQKAQSGAVINFPDPRPAIYQFSDDCGGIPLILAPLPNKAMILGHQADSTLANNVDFQAFVEAMEHRGIHVFWPFDNDSMLNPGFLNSDTHWTPAFMKRYAEELGAFLLGLGLKQRDAQPIYQAARHQQVTHRGDLAHMLNLKVGPTEFGSETITVEPVVNTSGAPWQSIPSAEILVLGDSYVNIFSDPSMGWGSHAGLGPHLSLATQMDLDVIALNGSAPTQTRAVLARRDQPLVGKRAVVWLFAIRDLAFGNWRPIPMPASDTSQEASPAPVPSSDEITLRAKLVTAPGHCDPQATPYSNAVIHLKFEVEEVITGTYELPELLASFQLMANRQLTEAAHLQAGRVYELTLIPNLPPHTQSWTLLDETEAYDLDPWWVIRFE